MDTHTRAILIYWTDFPTGEEPVQWTLLDEKSDGVHWIGSPPERKFVQYIRIVIIKQRPTSTLS